MAKLPAFQFYPGDWRKDPGVQSLSFHDRGVWFEILCLMHESEQRGKLLLNGKAMPQEALARLLGLDNQILTTTITNLLTYGVASLCEKTAALINRRMVRDEEIREVRKKCGKLGGNPNLLNQIPTTQDNQIPTPSSSSSSSISASTKKNKNKIFTPPTIEQVKDYALSKGYTLDAEYWVDYWIQRNWKFKGGNKMVDWTAAVRTWVKNNFGGNNGTNGKHPQQFESKAERELRRLKTNLGIDSAPPNHQKPTNSFLPVLPTGPANG